MITSMTESSGKVIRGNGCGLALLHTLIRRNGGLFRAHFMDEQYSSNGKNYGERTSNTGQWFRSRKLNDQ